MPRYSHKKFCKPECRHAYQVALNPLPAERACTRCKIIKPIDQFRARTERPHRRVSWCKACIGEVSKQWGRDNPERLSQHQSRWKYGISPAQRAAMISAQNGACAICKLPLSAEPRARHIDHNHETGRIRGVLCHACNLALGLTRESLDTLRAMVAYLEDDASRDPATDDRLIATQYKYLAGRPRQRGAKYPY